MLACLAPLAPRLVQEAQNALRVPWVQQESIALPVSPERLPVSLAKLCARIAFPVSIRPVSGQFQKQIVACVVWGHMREQELRYAPSVLLENLMAT